MLVLGLLAALSLQDRLARIDAQLKAAQFEAADRELRALNGAIAEHFGSGSQAMYTVGVISSFRALAAAGLNDSKDAEWYWSVAKSLYPKFAGSDLRVYGAAGEAVMRIDSSKSCEVPQRSDYAQFTGPKAIHTPLPKYPYHAVETGIAEAIVVDVIIAEDGTTRCPRVVDTHDDPSLAWALLEAMKDWRYEPALLDGRPVAVPLRQTIDFRLKY